jgi:hypothetical protein
MESPVELKFRRVHLGDRVRLLSNGPVWRCTQDTMFWLLLREERPRTDKRGVSFTSYGPAVKVPAATLAVEFL